MKERVFGTACLVVGAFLSFVVVALLAEPESADGEAWIPGFLALLSLAVGAVVLRQVEGPIYGAGRARRWVGNGILVLAAFFAVIFVGLMSEESGASDSGDAVMPLFLALLFAGVGLGLRGTRAFGSLRNNLTLLGIAVVALPVLLLLFVFALGGSDSSTEVIDLGNGVTTEDVGVTPGVLLTAVGLMAAGSAGMWFLSRRAVAPMSEITAVANEIQAGSLDRRIAMQGGAREVQELADSFDSMLDRLATASGTQQRLIEDASHELRTPLAALSVSNELLLYNDAPTADETRETAERNQALIERLQVTIDELLLQGRSQSQQLQQIDNDLMAIVARVADQHRVLNPDVPIAVRGPAELRLGVDGPSVQRAVANLVQNAARYSPPGMPVEIDVTPGEFETHLSVSDHGPGISPEDRDVIFERYYQADPEAGGAGGIGLALVKQVAEAHGRVEVLSPISATGGTRFTLTFRNLDPAELPRADRRPG